MKSLVEIINGFIAADTQVIAKEFKMKHNKVMDIIDNVLADYPDIRGSQTTPKTIEIIVFQEREYNGLKFIAAIMNREFFTLLMMRFETKRARELQRKFNAAFYEMERRLIQSEANKNDPSWVDVRDKTKLVRKEETDIIQQFVDYATWQGSENAKFYYKHITNHTYKVLGLIQHKQPKIRKTLETLELCWLASAEHVAKQSLVKHMGAGEFYKDIFMLVKQDLERFAETLMIPKPMVIQEPKPVYLN